MKRIAIFFAFLWPLPAMADCVVLLHGLARSQASFTLMEAALEAEGYEVVRPGYPSTSANVARLADAVMPFAFDRCTDRIVHFVTHSMGGILVREWMAKQSTHPPGFGRVVMLAPPNQGSEVVDVLGDLAAFGWFNGPAGREMGTGENSVPKALPPVDYPVGVIAGDTSLNPYFSSLLPGVDDGKVTVVSTRVDGMADHITLPVTHTFIMNSPTVIAQTLAFLQSGQFDTSIGWLDAVLDRFDPDEESGDAER
ncbi:MAG: alpha/beta fold hydrolase [Pseudomonadota bacterium]